MDTGSNYRIHKLLFRYNPLITAYPVYTSDELKPPCIADYSVNNPSVHILNTDTHYSPQNVTPSPTNHPQKREKNRNLTRVIRLSISSG